MPRIAVPDRPSAFAPFQSRTFLLMWATSQVSNLGGLIQGVGAAWQMTTLTSSPAMIALVQASTSLPVMLFSLLAGALADGRDRRRILLVAQGLMMAVSVALAVFAFSGWLTPWGLLSLTFLLGVGTALNNPAWQASVGDIVPREVLPEAVSLNAMGFNLMRSVGPALGGAIVATFGAAFAFVVNACSYVPLLAMLATWKPPARNDTLQREPFAAAVGAGLRYVAMSPNLLKVLLRAALFGIGAVAILALLPLVARGMTGGNAGTFTVLLAAMGAGAIASTFVLPMLRQNYPRDRVVLAGAATQALCMAVMAVTHSLWLGVPAMALGGAAWLSTANALSVSAQMSLPDWVRARGMSMYQMAIMGAAASGAAVWGQVATWSSVPAALAIGAASGIAAMALATWRWPDRGMIDDPNPAGPLPHPQVTAPPQSGHVVVTIEYRIDPAHAAPFRALMEESRSSRLRLGAVGWELLSDINDPGRFIEVIEDASWVEHLRRFERTTAADVALRERKLAYHLGDEPPLVRRALRESTVRGAQTDVLWPFRG